MKMRFRGRPAGTGCGDGEWAAEVFVGVGSMEVSTLP